MGKWVRVTNREGRRRAVRIVDVQGEIVVVDLNHRRAGQALVLELEVVAIQPVPANANAPKA